MSRRTLLIAVVTFLAITALVMLGEKVVWPPAPPVPEDESAPAEPGAPTPLTGTTSPAPPNPPEDERPPLVVITNVPGAEVRLRVERIGGEPDPAPVVMVADDEGIARFVAPPEGMEVSEIRGEARAIGYRTARGKMRGRELRLTLEPGVALRGIVMDGPGSAVRWPTFAIAGLPLQRAGEDGRFEIFVPEAGEIEMVVSSGVHLPAEIMVMAPASDLVIQLDRGLTISGQVTFPDGSAVPGVLVKGDDRQTRTDPDGRYVLSGYVPEDDDEEVRCGDYAEPRVARAGDTGVDFEFVEHVVRVRVVDEQGRPFKHGSVSIDGFVEGDHFFGLSGSLGADAEKLLDLPTGTELRIAPFAPGWAEEVTTVELTGNPRLHDIPVVMRRPPPPGAIEVHAVDQEDRPLPFVLLTLTDFDHRVFSEEFADRRVDLDEAGRGLVNDVPAGRYRLVLSTVDSWITLEGYGLPQVQDLEVPSAGIVTARTRIQNGGRIRLVVRDAEGEMVAPKWVHLLDEQGERTYVDFVHPLEDGRSTARPNKVAPALLGRPLPPGRYRLRILRDDAVAGEADVVVERGKTAEIEIHLER